MAVILHRHWESRWLSASTELSEVLSMLKPFSTSLMNAYPISNTSKTDISLVKPIGRPVLEEATAYVKKKRLSM